MTAPKKPTSTPEAHSGHSGHRQRLKERIDKNGAESLAEYELLEALLFYSVPRRDTKAAAKELLKTYKTINHVLDADADALKRHELISDHSITLFRITKAIARHLAEEKIINASVLASWTDIIDYCRTRIGFADKEYFLAIFVNPHNRVIAAEELATGTIDRVSVFPREVVRHALRYHAVAVILVHNHPSGDYQPSAQDIAMTKAISQAMRAVDAKLHDHLIISGAGHFSFKNTGLL